MLTQNAERCTRGFISRDSLFYFQNFVRDENVCISLFQTSNDGRTSTDTSSFTKKHFGSKFFGVLLSLSENKTNVFSAINDTFGIRSEKTTYRLNLKLNINKNKTKVIGEWVSFYGKYFANNFYFKIFLF